MKLAHKLARAVGGLFVAGAVASGANAAIDLPSSDVNNTGGSELILAVWDPTSQSTHVLDTGIAFNDVTSLTSGVIAQLDITGIDMANARWVALAADSQDSTAAPTAAEAGRRLITTSDSNTIDLVPTDRPNMGSALDNLTGFIARHNQQAQIDGLVGDDVQSNVAGLVEGSLGAWIGAPYGRNPFPILPDALVGETSFFMTVFEEFISTFGQEYQDTLEGELGTLTLNANGDLVFAAVDPIPLPAAAWLMISGLAGLVGVSRRRCAQA